MPPKNGPLTADQKIFLIAGSKQEHIGPRFGKEITDRELALRKKALNKTPPRSISIHNSCYQRRFQLHRFNRDLSDDVTRDVTFESSLWLENPAVAKFEDRILHPKQEGETKLIAEFQGKKVEIPVKVTAPTAPRPVSFKLDVMPVFMKAGCNTGSCHGSARGQDRFMLSLFGYDPEGDPYRITREQEPVE